MQTEENIYANPVPLPDEPILESFKKFIKKMILMSGSLRFWQRKAK